MGNGTYLYEFVDDGRQTLGGSDVESSVPIAVQGLDGGASDGDQVVDHVHSALSGGGVDDGLLVFSVQEVQIRTELEEEFCDVHMTT